MRNFLAKASGIVVLAIIVIAALAARSDAFSGTHGGGLSKPERLALIAEKEKAGDTFLVTRVIDGDTIEIEGGEKVRYIGMDTPETVDPRKSVQCFGEEAHRRNAQFVEGKMVRLEKDATNLDKYGRLLRYVYLDDQFINLLLVQEGFAHAYTYPPNVKYADQFVKAEHSARAQKRGLWSSCRNS